MKVCNKFVFGLSVLVCLQSAFAQDSLNVRRLGQLSYPNGGLIRVEVENGIAYCAASESGLRIIDVNNPENIHEVGFFDTPGTANDVAVANNFAYVADGDSGLRIIDISNPSSPNEVGFLDTPGLASGVAVTDVFVFVADFNTGGLRIINVANPSAPVELGFYDTPGYAHKVDIDGDLAFVADDLGGIRIIDWSDSENPSEVGFFETVGDSRDVIQRNQVIYVADQSGGLRVLYYYDESSPFEIGSYDAGNVWGLSLSENNCFLAAEGNGLRVVHVPDSTNQPQPEEVGFYDTPGFSYGVASDGNIAYVADFNFFGVYEYVPPSGVGDQNIGTTPVSFELLPCYPNPFNATTTISFSLSKQAMVSLNTFDIQGRLARPIANQTFTAGTHSLYFDASEFATGVYFVKMNSEEFSSTQKMVLMK